MSDDSRPGSEPPAPRQPDGPFGALTRRQFIPLTVGVPALGLSAGAMGADPMSLQLCRSVEFEYQPEVMVPVRPGLGVVVIGASSGMGAEIARQYADHGAYVVLAARRANRLADVAADVAARGGTPLVVVTDIRNDAECSALMSQSIAWLTSHGKAIDVCVLAAARVQASTFGPHMSMEVFRNVIETNVFGLASCVRYALPHLKQVGSTVFYFNSIASTVGFPSDGAYTCSAHVWQAMKHVLKFESPQLNFVSSQFAGVDTESWEKELTCFDDDKRYCPSTSRTYLGIPSTHENWYPESFAVAKAINAIESGREYAFLSHLNKACWLAGPTRQDLGWFLVMLESLAGYQTVQKAETAVGKMLQHPGQLHQLVQKLSMAPETELTQAAGILTDVDLQVALVLTGLEQVLPTALIEATRATVQAHHDSFADGSYEQLLIALASGTLSPSGIAEDDDGLAPIATCQPAGI